MTESLNFMPVYVLPCVSSAFSRNKSMMLWFLFLLSFSFCHHLWVVSEHYPHFFLYLSLDNCSARNQQHHHHHTIVVVVVCWMVLCILFLFGRFIACLQAIYINTWYMKIKLCNKICRCSTVALWILFSICSICWWCCCYRCFKAILPVHESVCKSVSVSACCTHCFEFVAISTIFISRSFYLTATFWKCTRAISPLLLCIAVPNCICSGSICDPHSNRDLSISPWVYVFLLMPVWFRIFFPFFAFVSECSGILVRVPAIKCTNMCWCVLYKMKWHLRIFQEPAVNWCKMRPLRQRIKLNNSVFLSFHSCIYLPSSLFLSTFSLTFASSPTELYRDALHYSQWQWTGNEIQQQKSTVIKLSLSLSLPLCTGNIFRRFWFTRPIPYTW